MRLELTQPNGHYPLKVACLPISPPPHYLLDVLSKRNKEDWSEKRDSNPRPRPWQGRALPTELFSQNTDKIAVRMGLEPVTSAVTGRYSNQLN